MTWSIHVNEQSPDNLVDALNEAWQETYPDPLPGMQEAYDAAIEAIPGFVQAVTEHQSAEKVWATVAGVAKQEDEGSEVVTTASLNVGVHSEPMPPPDNAAEDEEEPQQIEEEDDDDGA